MNGMPSVLWKPTHGLIPILEYPPPVQLDLEELQRAKMEEDPPKPCTGSPEHLASLLMDLNYLRDLYVHHQNPNTPEIQEAFQSVMEECLDLLNPPDTIHDLACRSEFFKIVREVAVQVTRLIEKRGHLKTAITHRHNTLKRILEKANGYQDGLPRWSQFLAMNAPGATKLRLPNRNFISFLARGYQVIPQGGIGILRNWDTEMYQISVAIDPEEEFNIWSPRIEWGLPSAHKLAFGVRRFDPLLMRPSPWAKEPRLDSASVPKGASLFRRELEELDRWIGKSLCEVLGICDPLVGSAEEPWPPAPDGYHLGLTLFPNIWTYEEMQYRQLEDQDTDAFGLVLVQRFIRDEDLERIRELHSLTAEQRNGLEPVTSAPHTGSSLHAGPSTSAGAQAGSSTQAGSAAQSSSAAAAGPSSQP